MFIHQHPLGLLQTHSLVPSQTDQVYQQPLDSSQPCHKSRAGMGEKLVGTAIPS